jgi:nucleotide-binding universal stress UspA family protein
MLSAPQILFPIDFTDSSRHLVQQVAWLARRFHAEIILLHVVTPLSYPTGILESGHEITERDLHAHVVQRAQEDLDQIAWPELNGIAVTRLLLRGDPANAVVEAARDRNVGLIAMPTHGFGEFERFLLGSATATVLRDSGCPVWTGAHLEETPATEFSIRHVLCAVDLTEHSRHAVLLAARMAAAVDATLTLVHITTDVATYGPGGSHVDPALKGAIIGFATEEISKLQQEVGTHAEVVIDGGDIPQLLNRVAEQTKADVLVIGRVPGRSHLGNNGHGYGIIRESHIPVLSV